MRKNKSQSKSVLTGSSPSYDKENNKQVDIK